MSHYNDFNYVPPSRREKKSHEKPLKHVGLSKVLIIERNMTRYNSM